MTPSSSSIIHVLNTFTKRLNRLSLIKRQLTSTTHKMTKTFKVAKVSDLKDGQMKEVEIPGAEGKVLLSRVKGSFYATGARCTRTSARMKQ
jgi:hypothetical protein